MKASPGFEFPPQQQQSMRKARRLEWLTIAYLISVVATMYLVMGSSQAMKTAWLEDMLSLIPPFMVLIASRIALWEPNQQFPYGYHRVVSIAFLAASLTLFSMGLWLCLDALLKLVMAEHPTIGSMTLGGHTFWQGWLMIPALLWSGLPAVFLGRAKLPLARDVHDKVLHTDAAMNKADWQTASAALAGVIGIGLGFWWADSLAAALISLSILRDGFTNLRQVVCDLMDEVPQTIDRKRADPLPHQVQQFLEDLPWVAKAQVRMREEGHVYFGEAFLIVRDTENLPAKFDQATHDCKQINWRLHDLVLIPVTSLED